MFTQTPRTSRKRNPAQFSALQPPPQPVFNPAPQQQQQQPFSLPQPFATEPSSSAVLPAAPPARPATTRSLVSDQLVEPISFIGSLYPDLRRAQETQRPSALARWSEKEEEHDAANDAIIDDARTTMDIEPSYAQSPTVLVKDEKHMVETLGKMPPEVLEVFENADFYQSAFAARVEPAHGYALVWTKSQALVWSYERSTPHSLPTCFIFPLSSATSPSPQSQSVPPLPLVALVPPSDSAHEPGLLASSPEGELRYWDAVSLALSSPDRYRGVRLYLNEGETVTALNSIGTGIYIIGTTHSRLLRVTLAPALACSALTRPVGVFARVGNLLGYRDPEAAGEDIEVSKAVIAVVPGNRVELKEVKIAREVYALTRRTLQKWIVSKNTVEKFIMEQDILTPIRDNILSNVGDTDPARDLKVALLDLDYGRDGQIVVLVSYVGSLARGGASSIKASTDEVLWYSLVMLELRPGGPWGDEFAVVERIDLKHSSYPDLRPRSNPILALPNGGPAAFIVFPDTIVMRTLFKGVAYEEEITLKNRQSDRVVGLGVDKDRTWSPEIVPTALVLVVASGSGILKCEMAVEVVRREMGEGTTQAVDVQARQTLYLKSKLEQAVFFDNQQRNPLSFDLTTEFDGNLNKAALDLSREILESTSKHIPSVMDIKMSLRERLNRLKSIIKYIDANRVMNKLSLDSRYQLCWDAERMAAAIDLWNYQNSVMGHADKAPHTKLLANAIKGLLQQLGDVPREDFVRYFFRSRVSQLGDLFRHVQRPLNDVSTTWQQTRDRGLLVNEANKIMLIILKAALQYRNDLQKIYKLDEKPRIECWTAVPELIDILQAQYEFTERTLRELGRDADDVMDLDETPLAIATSLQDQLCDMADVLLKAFVERIAFLELTSNTAAQERELRALEERYRDVRPKVIRPLVPVGRTENAFQLAERYLDFRSLVELSVGLQPTGSRARVQYYIGKFKEEFAYVLFEWYIENAMLRSLLDQDEMYNQMLHEFLEQGDGHPRISWIHNIRMGQYQSASQQLIQEAETEQNLQDKSTMLSIGKLAFLATVEFDELNNEDIHDAVQEDVDEKLDIVVICNEVVESFHAVLREKGGGPSLLDGKVKVVVDMTAAGLRVQNKLALEELYSRCVKTLLQGLVIPSEDLIDVLTLKDNEKNINDFFYGIEVYRRAREIPENRRQSGLRTVWRRTFAYDNWESLSVTQGLTDEQRRDMLMNTAVFQVVNMAFNQYAEEECFLKPGQCYYASPRDDLRTRFPGISDQQLDQLVNDYNIENKQLDLDINQYGLAQIYDEIRILEEMHRTGGYSDA